MYDLASLSLQPPASFPELYQELIWWSGSNLSIQTATAGSYFLQKGAGGLANGSTSSATKLYTHSANWSPSAKFSFEAAIWITGSGTSNTELWDITAGTAVSGSLISTSATTATVVRSGQFTLTPGHVYGVTLWNPSGGSNGAVIIDASLIIFPPAGSVSPSLSSISLANPSGGTLKEAYIPLWVYSSGTASSTGTGYNLLQKGTTTPTTTTTGSAVKLFTLSSAWSSSQKFALEASIYISSASANAQAFLYDLTAGTTVTGASFGTASTTATVIRSGSFTLTPNHSYGVAINTTNASYTANLTKAHLVALT